MKKYISLLRGINIWWKRKILMTDLKKLYEDLWYRNILTYIQSWNVIFESDESEVNIRNAIEVSIRENYEFDVPVILREVQEFHKLVKSNSSSWEDTEKLHVTFLWNVPDEELVEKVKSFGSLKDRFEIVWKNIFILCDWKYHESKLTNNFFEKKLLVTATTRNWKTVKKLVELSK